MEQFFGLVNSLLNNAPNTAKRKLSIATYKVAATASFSKAFLGSQRPINITFTPALPTCTMA